MQFGLQYGNVGRLEHQRQAFDSRTLDHEGFGPGGPSAAVGFIGGRSHSGVCIVVADSAVYHGDFRRSWGGLFEVISNVTVTAAHIGIRRRPRQTGIFRACLSPDCG